MIQLDDPRLPPELTPGNKDEILQRSKERRDMWTKQLEELRSLRRGEPVTTTPPGNPSPHIHWLSLLLGAVLGAAVVAIAGWIFL